MIFQMSLLPFFGRFHPVLVHLPIGILIFAIVIDIASGRERYKGLRPALPLAYLLGALSAIVSCITGYLLSQEGGYEDALLGQHRWMGIGVAVLATALFALQIGKYKLSEKFMLAFSLVLLVLISITGHLGGSLTHGKDYLTEYSPFHAGAADTPVKRTPIVNIAQAQVYRDIVAPILQDKCRGCHNMAKQKGGLRMDDFAWLMKGGKHGVVVAPGYASGSEMMKRITLPVSDEKHMPPIDKEQLTKPEISLLNWWIGRGAAAQGTVEGMIASGGGAATLHEAADEAKGAVQGTDVAKGKAKDTTREAEGDKSGEITGADETKGKTKETAIGRTRDTTAVTAGDQTMEVVQLIKAWQAQRFPPVRKSIVPEQEVAKADGTTVNALSGKSIIVLPAGANSHYLSVDFVNYTGEFHQVLPLLEKIGAQIVWLQAGGTDIADADLGAIAAFPNLLRLHLEHTTITDAGLAQLKTAAKLEYLNLVGTAVTKEGVKRLSGLNKLKEIYLYQTPVTEEQVGEIQLALPKTAIYAGSYSVPAFAEDTMRVTKPAK